MKKGQKMSLEARARLSSIRIRQYEIGELSRKVFCKGKRDGRWYVNCRDGKKEAWARIVYQNAYLNGEKIPSGCDIHHKDKNSENDIPENLKMETRSDHSKLHFSPEIVFSESSRRKNSEAKKGNKNYNWGKSHSSETRGRISKAVPKGKNHYKSKLKEEDVVIIKQLLNNKLSLSEISRMYSVNYNTISQIKTGKTWKYI